MENEKWAKNEVQMEERITEEGNLNETVTKERIKFE